MLSTYSAELEKLKKTFYSLAWYQGLFFPKSLALVLNISHEPFIIWEAFDKAYCARNFFQRIFLNHFWQLAKSKSYLVYKSCNEQNVFDVTPCDARINFDTVLKQVDIKNCSD